MNFVVTEPVRFKIDETIGARRVGDVMSSVLRVLVRRARRQSLIRKVV
jgi:hypothetical protein